MNATEVAESISLALKKFLHNVEIVSLPLADGGEGTLEIMKEFYHMNNTIVVNNAIMQPTLVSYLSDHNQEKVFIESASIIGLPMIVPDKRNPMKASSFGLGETISHAINNGAKEIVVSLGGSATCDGGIGMLTALGFIFFDNFGNRLEGKGEDLHKIKSIDFSNVIPGLNNVCFKIVCDVVNPLLGKNGTVNIFSSQKGAQDQDKPILEAGLINLANLAIKSGIDKNNNAGLEGAGAAGGLGYAFITFLNGLTFKGIDFILDITNFDNEINEADLIITGEGKIDRQSLMGKALSGILAHAKLRNVPVVGIGGSVEDKNELILAGLLDAYSISDSTLSLEENLKPQKAKENIQNCIKNMLKENIFSRFL